jgi:hypothetical protein
MPSIPRQAKFAGDLPSCLHKVCVITTRSHGNQRVMLRSVLVDELNDELNGGTQVLQRLAGIPDGWQPLAKSAVLENAAFDCYRDIRDKYKRQLGSANQERFVRSLVRSIAFWNLASFSRAMARTPSDA